MSDIIINVELDEGVVLSATPDDNVVVNIVEESPVIINMCDGNVTAATDYANLTGKPKINEVELIGDKSLSQLGIEPKKGVDDFYITNAEKTQGGLATGNSTLATINQVANKAQFAPNENGTILYHVAKWFTPTGTISTNGTTVTSTSAQFASAMVGAKLIIMGEERIITAFTGATVVVVDNAYSQNYLAVPSSNWCVFSKATEIKSDGLVYTYNILGGIFFKGSSLGANSDISTNGGELRIKGSGNILGSVNIFYTFSSTSDSNTTKDIGFKRSSSGILEINNGTTAGVYRDLNLRNLNYYGTLNNASDERLKHDIKTVNNALDKCCAIAECVRHFEFNDQNIYAKGQRTGFIAQLLRDNGFDGHISEREPNNEEEGAIFGWSYKDEYYEEENPETNEAEFKTRRIVDIKGDMVLQIENNFSPYVYPALSELRKENELLKERLRLIEGKLGI